MEASGRCSGYAPARNRPRHSVRAARRRVLRKKLVQGRCARHGLSIRCRAPTGSGCLSVLTPTPHAKPSPGAASVCHQRHRRVSLSGSASPSPDAPHCSSYTPLVNCGGIISFPLPCANYTSIVYPTPCPLAWQPTSRPAGGRRGTHSGDSWQASLWE